MFDDLLLVLSAYAGIGVLGWMGAVAISVQRPTSAEWFGAIFPGAMLGPLSLMLFWRAAVEISRPYRRPWFAKRR